MVDEHQLYLKLKEIKTTLERREWKYYHIKSVENFIYHLKSFKNEKTRKRMAGEIEKYMQLVSEKMNDESKVHDKFKELFPSIWKISDTYKYEIGFIQKPSYLVSFILLIGLFLLLKFSLDTGEALGVCAFFFSIYTIYCYFKTKARKVC